MRMVWRFAVLLLILSSVVIGASLVVGRWMETDAYATYRILDDGRRMVHITDPSSHVSLDLMETHCFDNIPYGDLPVILPDESPQPVLPLDSDDPLAVVRRLSCTGEQSHLSDR